MADKSIKITIATALNAAGFTAAKRAISSLVSGTRNFAAKVGSNLMNIKAGFDIIAGSAQKFLATMSKGMEFERMTLTFKALTGDMELAAAHMKDLQDLGRTPPFSLETFAAASQMMMKMTGGMLGYKESLEMVGDIASATGNDISAVARSVGLAYQMLRDGQPFGRAGSQMVQLGILTKAQVEYFDELSKAGGDNMAAWEELTKVLGKYKGAMADTEKTAKGMVEAIQGEATVAMTDFSAAVMEEAKPALEGLLGYLRQLNEDGTIEDWADSTIDALHGMIPVVLKIADGLNWLFKVGQSVFAKPMAAVKAAREAKELGMSNKDALQFIRDTQDQTMKNIWSDESDDDDLRKLKREERKAAKAKRRAEQAAKAEAEAKKRIEEDFAKAKERRDEKAAETETVEKKILFGGTSNEFLDAYYEEQEKAAKDAAKAELAARRDAMKKLHDERMKQLDKEQERVQKLIDDAKAKGYDSVMATAGGGFWGQGTLDQAGEARSEHQAAVDAARAAKAEEALRAKMAKRGATLDDPSKLGRMSNLERAAFERMKLAEAEKQAAKIQKERDAREAKMAADLDAINKKMQEVGL